jgi:hypothetical protein
MMESRWDSRTAATGHRKNPEGISSICPAVPDKIGLHWVNAHKLKSTLQGLNQIAADGDATPSGLMIFWGRLTQGSSCLATLG